MHVAAPGRGNRLPGASVVAAAVATALGIIGTPNALDRWVASLPFEHLAPGLRAGIAQLTRLGAPLVLMVLAALVSVGLLLLRERRAAGLLFATTAIAAALFPLLKRGFGLPRPGAGLVEASGYGLPSGHSLVSAVMWACLAWVIATRLRPSAWRTAGVALCLALPVAIGLSRIVLEVHWLTDVVAGWLYGVALVGLALWLDDRGRRGPGR